MSTETATKTDETKQDPKVASMLKALGYLDDPAEQAKLPADREADAETTTEEVATTEGDKPEVDASAVVDEAKPEEKAEVKTEAAKPEEKKEEPAKTEPVDDKAAKKVKREAPPKSPSLDEIVDAIKDAVKPATQEAKTEEKKDDTFRKSLHPAELKALELAEAASKFLGDKYKDAAEKEIEWIRKHRQAAQANAQRNEGKFDPNDEEYKEFVRTNRTGIPQHDRDEVFMRQAEERAAERIKKEMRKDIEQRDRAIAELKFTPVIEKIGVAVKAEVMAAGGEEFAKAYAENPKTAEEDFPLEAPIVKAAMNDAVILSQEYIALSKQVKEFDENNTAHNRIISFINQQGELLDAKAKEGQPFVRDGKTVISRAKFYNLASSGKDVTGYSTLEDRDIVNMISFAAKSGIEQSIASERKRLDAIRSTQEKRAAAKVSPPAGETKPAAETQTKDAGSPPKGGTSPSKGASAKTSATKTVPAHLKAMGYGDA